jgi:autotransporter-associated beta strand protein
MARRASLSAFLCLTIVATTAGPAGAQYTYTWTAPGGAGNWNTVGNWAPGTGFPLLPGDVALFDFQTGAGAVTLSSAVTVGAINFNNLSGTPNQSFTISGSTINFANPGAGSGIALSGGANNAGTQTISSGLAFLTPTATFTIANDAAPGVNTLTVSGAISGTTSLTRLVVSGASDTTITSTLVSGAVLNLYKTGTGTLTLGGSNTFSGGLTLAQGTVVAKNSNALGVASGGVPVVVGDATTGSNPVGILLGQNGTTTLAVANNVVVSAQGTGPVTLGTTSFTASTASTFSGRLRFDRPVTLLAGSSDRTEFSGLITGNVGTLTVTGLAAGNRVSFSNTAQHQFVGDVAVASGTLQLSQNNVLPFATNLNIAAGATVYDTGTAATTSVTNTIAGLSGSGTLSSNQAAANVLVVGYGGASATFAGRITNNGTSNVGLTKIGTGTQTLGGSDNSTMAATTVYQGALSLDYTTNNDAKIGTAGGLTLGGGTLQVTGNAAAFAQLTGNVTAMSGASAVVVGPGATTLTLAGNDGNTLTRNAGRRWTSRSARPAA